jgi:hypothetical protein
MCLSNKNFNLIYDFMKLKNIFLIISFVVLLVTKSYADSPLTSIEIWRVFPNNSEVQKALKTKKLDNSAIKLILNEENSLELRICVINALGWNIKSEKTNSDKLLKAILKKYNVHSINELNVKKYSEIISCYSYVYAMNNYFNVSKILPITIKAVSLDPENMAVNYVYSLIRSQHYLISKQWCNLYLTFENFKKKNFKSKNIDKSLTNLTYRYINGYRKSCPFGKIQ